MATAAGAEGSGRRGGLDRITIVGLGPVGVSIGSGLKRAGLEDTEIVGADRDRDALSRASASGAVDRAERNLGSALQGAQLVVLDWPLSETRELMEAIGPVLDEGCVVTDTGKAKTEVMRWANEYLGPEVDYVGGRPLLRQVMGREDAADPDIFQGVHYCVIPAEAARPRAVKTVVGMVEALGASPYFLNAGEHDSYAAAVTHLPLLLSSAVLTSAASNPSWREMSRLAGAEFNQITQLADFAPEESSAGCKADADALLHWVDLLIAELDSYRAQLQQDGDGLLASFIRAWEERARWELGAVALEPEPQGPTAAQTMAGSVLGSRLVDRYMKLTAKKRPAWKYPSGGN